MPAKKKPVKSPAIVLDSAVVAEENRQLVKGLQRVGVLSTPAAPKSGHAGSSPALAVACPVCEQPAGDYCMKENGAPQIIAHKKRRELAASATAGLCVCAEAPKPHAQHREDLYSAADPLVARAKEGCTVAFRELEQRKFLAGVKVCKYCSWWGISKAGQRCKKCLRVYDGSGFAELEQRTLGAPAKTNRASGAGARTAATAQDVFNVLVHLSPAEQGVVRDALARAYMLGCDDKIKGSR